MKRFILAMMLLPSVNLVASAGESKKPMSAKDEIVKEILNQTEKVLGALVCAARRTRVMDEKADIWEHKKAKFTSIKKQRLSEFMQSMETQARREASGDFRLKNFIDRQKESWQKIRPKTLKKNSPLDMLFDLLEKYKQEGSRENLTREDVRSEFEKLKGQYKDCLEAVGKEYRQKRSEIYYPSRLKLQDSGGLRGLSLSKIEDNYVTIQLFDALKQMVSADDAEKVEFIDISGTTFGRRIALPAGIFSRFPNIQKIILKNNSISEIPRGVFKDLPKLEVIDLSENKISQISQGAFEDLPSLKRLDLSNNKFVIKLKGLARGEGDTTLQVIDLRSLINVNPEVGIIGSKKGVSFVRSKYSLDKLYEVPKDVAIHVKAIDLSGSNIQKMPAGLFSRFPNVEVIILKLNRIKNIPKDVFANLPYLTTIALVSNSIESVEDAAFRNLPALKRLSLAMNPIKEISPSSFVKVNPEVEIVGPKLIGKLPDLPVAPLRLKQLILQKIADKNLDTKRVPKLLLEVGI